LYSNVSPYSASEEKYIDHGYPHTNILADLLELLFKTIDPVYIVASGSMVGGSAIRMAQTSEAQIVCIDPFTGDVNMWDWERNDGWKFLRLEKGIPTIYNRFLANCKEAGFEDRILPINCTTSVGIKLLQRLKDQERISALPNYIYLDSAHEKDETFLELSLCWNLLPPGGVLFGDDWNWDAVRHDVVKFSETIVREIDYETSFKIQGGLFGSEVTNGNILLYLGQWVLVKMA
jgi:predicted O-methyltransferase YrrM